MARTRSSLVAAAATIAALAAPTTASAALVTDCDDLQTALDTQSVVTIAEGLTCHGGFHLPSSPILLEGGGNGATLSGDDDGRTQILSGVNVGTTTIRNLTFVDGQADETDGGAIGLEGNSPVTIEDNDFIGNEALTGEGGGRGGAVALELDNQVVAPQNARGAALPPIVLRGNTFEGNVADDRGGAVYIDAFLRSVIVDDNVFEQNEADENGGGGLYVDASQSVTLSGNVFDHNQAADDGGGANLNTCAAEITSNVFDGNRIEAVDASLDGGGLFLVGYRCGTDELAARGGGSSAAATQEGNLFVENQIRGQFSNGRGAGEFTEQLTVLSTDDRFVGNSITGTNAAFGGGLAYGNSSSDGAPLTARNLVAAGNVVDPQQAPTRGDVSRPGFGGGLFLAGAGADFRIEDSTVEGNSAPVGAGISGNPFIQGGARGLQTNGLVLHNSIVYGNPSASGGDLFGFSSRDVRSSDVCDGGAPHGDGDGTDPNSNLCVDPKLQAPSDDGNVDQGSSSPTRDRGDNALVDPDLATDYAADGRVLDGKVDIGADEFKGAPAKPPVVQPPAAQPAPQGAVQGVQQRSCRSKRVFRIRIRVPRGKKALSATVRVNNKKVKVVRGKRLRAPVRLRGLPKGRFKVKITIRLKNGKKITGTRTYHTCIPRLPGDGPPKV